MGHVGELLPRLARPPLELANGLWGGPELATTFESVRRVAASDLPVVIVGPTGSGKERVARAIHAQSGLKGPFVAINCAALPQHLAEAELFGYRRGAFTGAERPSLGYFRAAQAGTLFLDELAELPFAIQAKLLRVLQERCVIGLGETMPVPVDARLVVAVQEPLDDLVRARRLREDLAARVAGFIATLPPLRARRADVAGLFRHFARLHNGGRLPPCEARLMEALCIHDWPQNVRELELLAKRFVVLHGHEPLLRHSFLPESVIPVSSPSVRSAPQPRRQKRSREEEMQSLLHVATGERR